MIQQNLRAGRKIFAGMEDYVLYAGLIHQTETESFEAIRHFREILRDYPDTILILNIRDREDCSCILADDRGLLIAQAEHIPGHLGILNLAMAEVCRRFPRESWAEGDVVIFNEPYEGGGYAVSVHRSPEAAG